jgi:hypothetical protein
VYNVFKLNDFISGVTFWKHVSLLDLKFFWSFELDLGIYIVISFSVKMIEIRLKTVEYAQFKFEKLAEVFSNLSNVVRIGGQKTAMGRISTKWDEIQPPSVLEILLLAFDHF